MGKYMDKLISALVGLLAGIFANNGFWTWITSITSGKNSSRKIAEERLQAMEDVVQKLAQTDADYKAELLALKEYNSKMNAVMVGLTHDRIMNLSTVYVTRGYVTREEYENLHDYIWVPYAAMGGNGSAKRMMAMVEKLPLPPTHEKQ